MQEKAVSKFLVMKEFPVLKIIQDIGPGRDFHVCRAEFDRNPDKVNTFHFYCEQLS
jgi:hypothetical protein